MAINKKAVFLSLSALLIIGSIIIIFNADPARTNQQAIENRLQDFTQDRVHFEEQTLPALLRVHTRQALNELARAQIAGSISVTDRETLHQRINECLGATKNTEEHHLSTTSCADQELEESLRATSQAVQEAYKELLRYETRIVLHELNISQINPWQLLLEANMSVALNDTADLARYQRTHTITTTMRIQGLIDPLASTQRGDIHTIRRAENRNWSQETLTAHAREGTYTLDNNTGAPNYLERVLGTPASGEFGILSLLPPSQADSSYSSVDFDTQEYEETACLGRVQLLGGDSIYLSGPQLSFYRQFDSDIVSEYDERRCIDAT